MKSTLKQVESRVFGKKRGWVFTPVNFSDLGSGSSVSKALKVLADRGTIRRLARGLYHYPRIDETLGELSPGIEQIARAIAGKTNNGIQPSGAYAANLLGLTNQVPNKVVFFTDGKSRTVQVGRQTIQLKSRSLKTFALKPTTALVYQALKYLGPENIDCDVIAKLKRNLSKDQRHQLFEDIRLVPEWVRKLIRQILEDDRE